MTVKNETSFEENLANLENIVARLEKGDTPLEEALAEFQTGIKLSQSLQKTLNEAENTLTKMINDQGEEVNFDADNEY